MQMDPLGPESISADNPNSPILNAAAQGTAVTELVADRTLDRGPNDNAATFALVIGIDAYETMTPKLAGCVEDASDFVEYLREDLHTPESHIRLLKNSDASRHAIITTFRSHLTENPKIRWNDRIFFYFAGHGGRVHAPRGWVVAQGLIETICPWDEGSLREEKIVAGIPDITLVKLMQELTHRRGNNVIAVMDCCHSGGMARTLRAGTPRTAVNFLPERPPPPVDLDQAIRENPDASAEPMYSYVTLAACHQEETALENRIKPKMESSTEGSEYWPTRGLFTVHLLTFLRKERENPTLLKRLTYKELVRALLLESPETAKLCGAALDGQHPLCEGLHRDRLLFQLTTKTKEQVLTVKQRVNLEGAIILYIDIGRAAGVVQGTVFAIIDAPGMPSVKRGDIFLTAESVQIDSCIVSQNEAAEPERLDGAKVEVVAWTKDLMRVKASTDVPLSHMGFRFDKVLPEEECDLLLKPGTNRGEWSLTRFDPLVKHYMTPNPSESLTSTWEPKDIIAHVAHWNYHLYRSNTSFKTRKELHFDLEVYQLDSPDWGQGLREVLVPHGKDLLADALPEEVPAVSGSTYNLLEPVREARIQNEMKTSRYGLTLRNKSSHPLFVYMVYFDLLECSISQWYPPKNHDGSTPVSPGSPLAIGHGPGDTAGDTFMFKFREGAEKETGFLKVFVSTQYVDMSYILQGSLDGHRPTDRGVIRGKPSMRHDWNGVIYAVTWLR